jgi:hypothetical protein
MRNLGVSPIFSPAVKYIQVVPGASADSLRKRDTAMIIPPAKPRQ